MVGHLAYHSLAHANSLWIVTFVDDLVNVRPYTHLIGHHQLLAGHYTCITVTVLYVLRVQ